MIKKMLERKSPAPILWFSISASILTLLLKTGAFYVTGSVGFLSDAMESVINLIAGIVAFLLLSIAYRPPDKDHPFGHDKAEYFSSMIEGILIVLAAIGIGYAAVERLLHPKPLDSLDFGMVLSVLATLINFATARILLHYGRKHKSITLEADAHHLMTDVWTTVGILAGVVLVKFTNWYILDPIIAIVMAIGIVYTGIKLIKGSSEGLMDTALSKEELELVKDILNRFKEKGVDYHALYTRRSASKSFITFHILIHGDWTIFKGHEITKQIENAICEQLPFAEIFIHIEPLNDPDSFDDLVDASG